MTYNVFSGTLNLLTSLHLQLTRCIMLANRRHLHRHKYYGIIIDIYGLTLEEVSTTACIMG